jgi:hypothetical protein
MLSNSLVTEKLRNDKFHIMEHFFRSEYVIVINVYVSWLLWFGSRCSVLSLPVASWPIGAFLVFSLRDGTYLSWYAHMGNLTEPFTDGASVSVSAVALSVNSSRISTSFRVVNFLGKCREQVIPCLCWGEVTSEVVLRKYVFCSRRWIEVTFVPCVQTIVWFNGPTYILKWGGPCVSQTSSEEN